MLLTITEIGRQIETEALTSGYFPPVEAIVIGDGTPHAAPETATALVNQVLSVPVSVVERLSAQAVQFHATIPQGQTLTIREFGLILEDGTLYGYLPYETVIGAPLHKHSSFAFSFSLAVSREPLPPIEVNYSPVDTEALASIVVNRVQDEIDSGGAIIREGDIGTLVQSYAPSATEDEMQDGSVTEPRAMSPADVKSAILAIGPSVARTILYLNYDDREKLRTNEADTTAIIDGLGLFQWHAGSDEPDDDESCFATASGRWLMEAAHWDVISAWRSPDDESRDDRLDSAESRWPGRVLFGSVNQTVTSIAAVTQVAFDANIPGANAQDHVIVTPPSGLGGRISVFARVTAADTVTIYLNNPSAAAQSLATGDWRVAVIQDI